ncbi:hypothetical protein [Gordonia alkanivorans]|uniref:Uncharacterized protein n=2 Tax=root TaxID=1 RepID=A0A162E120_9CAUD|nr:hypothetical protein [Gordonia alkanivorans]YP_009324413.1 hypothetical protein BOX05_gp21 [Gordonia phage GAL1]AKJ72036.1 hypothetical protein GAL1_21 [Gordonia phage GAL1]GAA13822.1 hypothetical protein GOALK_093_00100 [Gordonia alkanivorans NBRC 16433]
MTTEDLTPEEVARNERVDRLAAALFLAFGATGGTSSVPILRPVAEVLDAFGVVQTEPDSDEVQSRLASVPGWAKERIREEAQPVPVEPNHHGVQETRRVRVAPKRPKRIPKDARGVITTPGA